MRKKKKKVSILFRFGSLKMTLLIPFLVLIVATILTYTIISMKRHQEIMFRTSADYTQQLVDMANGDIDSYFLNMENIAQLIMQNVDVRSYLKFKEKDKNTAEYLQCVRRVEQQFKTLRDTRNDIYNIGIIGWRGNYLINDEETEMNPYADLTRQSWYQKAKSGEEGVAYSHVQNIVRDRYPWTVTLSRAIWSQTGGEEIGVLFIDMNYETISSLCQKINLGKMGYVFILDSDGKLVYHPKQQLIYGGVLTEEIKKILETGRGSFYSGDGQKIYTVSVSRTTGLTVVGVTRATELLQKSNQMKDLFLLVAILLISAASLVSVLIADRISEPIRDLGRSMKEVEKGNFDITLENPGFHNVIGDLIGTFNMMIGHIRDLIRQIKEEQEEKRKSELMALQAQINPHFLYNTLDSIIWMSEAKKNEEVIRMTSSLSKLLRRSIMNDREFVTVAEEIDYVNEYLRIQKMRYYDKLDYSIRVADRILGVSMGKMILQPLVENAIYHGVKLKEGGGRIDITGDAENGRTVIRIRDDGAGMDAETLEKLLVQDRTQGTNKVGVFNVNRRIQLYYGTEYGLKYESSPGTGTTVSVLLPYPGEEE